jgi:hypothetical protein
MTTRVSAVDSWHTASMVLSGDSFRIHFDIEQAVPEVPGRIGFAALGQALKVGQRGRVKRAVNTLVALEVLQWSGQRRGRAVTQGLRKLSTVLDAGVLPMPDREIATYPLLVAAVDDFITGWHAAEGHTFPEDVDPLDAVNVYVTASKSAGRSGAAAAFTRPDLTVVVDLEFGALGPWVEVHAVEVKPFWGIDRAALFEAAAQAALRRCTYSWLLAWIPNPDSEHFSAASKELIERAADAKEALAKEAADLGLGFIVTSELGEEAVLTPAVEPRRQTVDPVGLSQLLTSLRG